MSTHAPQGTLRRYQRYVALLMLATFPLVAAVELAYTDITYAPNQLRLVSYAVLATWAAILSRRDSPNTVLLVLATLGFSASLAVIEAVSGVQVSALDFATSLGMVMLLGVLASVLAARRRLVTSSGIALFIALWAVAMGVLRGEAASVVGVRVVIAVAGVVFTTALVSRLFDELTEARHRFRKSARLHDAITRCSEALLVQPDAHAVTEAVRALLEATHADYAYVDKVQRIDGELAWEIVAEAAHDPDLATGGWSKDEYSSLSAIFKTLEAGQEVVIHTRDLEPPEREAYEADGIVSEACVPIFVDGVFRGSIGFIEYTRDRTWTEEEIDTLWRASHMIGAYWRRQDDQDELRASNESKDRLLSSVSHEVRTPLTAIVGLADEIVSRREHLSEEEVSELIEIIAVQGRELAVLIEDLLVASRAEGGNLSIKPDAINLLKEAENVLQGIGQSQPTEKAVVSDGDDVVAWADPLRVRQILRNLVTNALRYGGDKIVVGVWEVDGVAQVMVSDDGPGVPPEEAELIFERYYRGAQSSTQPGSVGIGLAVSRQLAELMDGTLGYVRDEAGHRFELSLPLAPAQERSKVSSAPPAG